MDGFRKPFVSSERFGTIIAKKVHEIPCWIIDFRYMKLRPYQT
ncbi:hypothetical protein [Brevibacillus laterosporus]|nr:hypothetical protein [Brevibacillus laterosporus]